MSAWASEFRAITYSREFPDAQKELALAALVCVAVSWGEESGRCLREVKKSRRRWCDVVCWLGALSWIVRWFVPFILFLSHRSFHVSVTWTMLKTRVWVCIQFSFSWPGEFRSSDIHHDVSVQFVLSLQYCHHYCADFLVTLRGKWPRSNAH